MNLLVTGGAGFIGSNFVNMVLKEHPEVKVTVLDALTYCGNLDNFPQNVWENKNFSFCQGNILDRDLVFDLMKDQDEAVHFAAFTHIDRSIDLSDPFIDTDFKGTHILLEAIREYPVRRFVHISTSEVYGSAQKVPMDESHPLNPQSPYAAAKAGADRLVYSYFLTYGLPVVIIRPFNAYGPNQYPEKLIPFFITNTILDKNLLIYGNGKNTRDWTYVKDCVRGIWKVLQAPSIEGEVINLGSGKEVDVVGIAEVILEEFRVQSSEFRVESSKSEELKVKSSKMEFIGDRPGHVKRLIASYDKAENILDWHPEIEFEEGLKRTITWYMDNTEWWEKIREKPEFKNFEKLWYDKLKVKSEKVKV